MPEARRADRRAASADQAACIIITIIISLSTKNNTFCILPLHVYCIHLARGMMRMRIPSIIMYCGENKCLFYCKGTVGELSFHEQYATYEVYLALFCARQLTVSMGQYRNS